MTLYDGAPQPWMIEFGSGSKEVNFPEELREGRYDLLAPGPNEFVRTEMPWDQGLSVDAHPSWALWLYSLKWLDKLMTTPAESAPFQSDITLALDIVHSWAVWANGQERLGRAWDPHPMSLRLTTLVALSEFAPEDPILRLEIDLHVAHIMDRENFDGLWNHGLIQSLALLGAGLRLDRKDAVGEARWRIRACLDEMIDDEGAINEQAPGYSQFIHGLFSIALAVYRANGLPGRSVIAERLSLLELFIAHSTQPDGYLVSLGDTGNVRPPRQLRRSGIGSLQADGFDGVSPQKHWAWFRRGFVFARSSWGETREFCSSDFFSFRFGPARIIHGHNDHLSVTWMWRGRHLIVDSGHFGYRPGEYRDYLRSVSAHNVVTIDGARHRWDEETSLDRIEEGAFGSIFGEGSDVAYPGFRRARSFVFTPDGPLVILDRIQTATSGVRVRQLWHFDPDLQVISAGLGVVRLEGSGGLALEGHAIRLGGGDRPECEYSRGATEPYQGWFSREPEEMRAAPAVAVCCEAPVAILTVWVPTGQGHRANVDFVDAGDGWTRILVECGDVLHTYRVSSGGYCSYLGATDMVSSGG